MKVYEFAKMALSLQTFHEGFRFGIAGITTTAICWGSYIAFVELLKFHYLISNNLATFIAWTYAYYINKYFVFRNKKRKDINKITKFIALQTLLLGWTNLVLYLLVGRLGMHYLLVVIGNGIFLVLINFLCQKIFISSDPGKLPFAKEKSWIKRRSVWLTSLQGGHRLISFR